jgi:hypothetical protein
MDNNLDDLENIILKEFMHEDSAQDGNFDGSISIADCGDCLRRCKKLSLTPF